VRELAADGIPVAVTCRVLSLSRQPYYRWLKQPFTPSEVTRAYRANAVFDAHKDDPEFGYRLLTGEARAAGWPMCERTTWRLCRDHSWWSVFGRKRGRNGKRRGPPVHDDLVQRPGRIVGYSIDSRMKARLAVAALEHAPARRGEVAGCIVHSDSETVRAGYSCGV